MSLTKLSLVGNYDIIYKLFPPRESLVGDIPAGDENIEKLFLRCNLTVLTEIASEFDPLFSSRGSRFDIVLWAVFSYSKVNLTSNMYRYFLCGIWKLAGRGGGCMTHPQQPSRSRLWSRHAL